ncbi:MAG: Hpt domain [Solirubrobacteraceae bacterium]|nr:Hpt domain [Solirubrobacteraceae bacterium]
MIDEPPRPFGLDQLEPILDRRVSPGLVRASCPPVVDPAFLRNLGLDGGGPAREIVEIFGTDAALRLAAMRAALGRDAGQDIADAAHALRGGSAMIGATRVERLCAEIERNCAPVNPPVLGPLLDRLDEALAETAAAFGAMLAEH